jgi:hypothetical protein
MHEKIAFSLEIDTPELFSMPAIPAEALKKLQKAVLTDIEAIIAARLKELDTTSFRSCRSHLAN